MTNKLSKKKDSSEILIKKYSRKKKYEKRIHKINFNNKGLMIGGSDVGVIDKDKLSFKYLLGLKFKQLNRNRFNRLFNLLTEFKLRTSEEKIQLDIFRNGIKMMKYYQKFLKFMNIHLKISNKLVEAIKLRNLKINGLINAMNTVLKRINELRSNIVDDNINNDTELLRFKIKYENIKSDLMKLLMYKTDKDLFKRNIVSLKKSSIGYLLYLYRKSEARFNHIFLKFNEKAYAFTKSFENLQGHYSEIITKKQVLESREISASKLDVEHFYTSGLDYEFLPKNKELKKRFTLKGFNNDQFEIIINEWLNHYRMIIEDLPKNLKEYKNINKSLNIYGIFNNPYSKPYFNKEIRKQQYESTHINNNINNLREQLKTISDPTLMNKYVMEKYTKSSLQSGGAIVEKHSFLSNTQINSSIFKLNVILNQVVANNKKLDLKKIDELQTSLIQIIGSIIHSVNNKDSHFNKHITNTNDLLDLINSLHQKLLTKDYKNIDDLHVLENTFAKVIIVNQMEIVSGILIIISRLEIFSSNKELLKKYRSIRDTLIKIKTKVTKRIVQLNGGKEFSIDNLPKDGRIIQTGGDISINNLRNARYLGLLKSNIINKLIGYFSTDFKEHVKLDMGYLEIRPEITFSNYDKEHVTDESGINSTNVKFKTKHFRLDQKYNKSFKTSSVKFNKYNDLRSREFNINLNSYKNLIREDDCDGKLLSKFDKESDELKALKEIESIYDINVIGRTKLPLGFKKIKRFVGLNNTVEEIGKIIKSIPNIDNIASIKGNSCFRYLGDKLIESYFINDLPLFAGRLLEVRNIQEENNRRRGESITKSAYKLEDSSNLTQHISLPLGNIITEIDRDVLSGLSVFDITTLNLPDNLINDKLVSKFIKILLMIPEKDLLTMLTNFEKNGDKNVGDNDILKYPLINYHRIYNDIFGYNTINIDIKDKFDRILENFIRTHGTSPNDIAQLNRAVNSVFSAIIANPTITNDDAQLNRAVNSVFSAIIANPTITNDDAQLNRAVNSVFSAIIANPTITNDDAQLNRAVNSVFSAIIANPTITNDDAQLNRAVNSVFNSIITFPNHYNDDKKIKDLTTIQFRRTLANRAYGGGNKNIIQKGGNNDLNIPIFAYGGYDSSNNESKYQNLSSKYPNVLFIFNDNFTENYTGTGGNAVIRGRTNAFGIPTGAYQSDKAFVNNDSLYNTNTNTIVLDTKVIRSGYRDNPTVKKILDDKLKELKDKIKPNDKLVFKAIVYSSKLGNIDIATDLFTTNNGTNDTIKDYIRDQIIKKISNYNDTTNSFVNGIKQIPSADDLKNGLDTIGGVKSNIMYQNINFNDAKYDNLFKNSNLTNTIQVIKYDKKYTAVSTRFYQLKMKQLLMIMVDRIKYYLNNTYKKSTSLPGSPPSPSNIEDYISSIREEIKTNTEKLDTYLDTAKISKINNRKLAKRFFLKFDMKKDNKDFYVLTRKLIKLINEETKLTNLVYIIEVIANNCKDETPVATV
jgi:hypothetical protein